MFYDFWRVFSFIFFGIFLYVFILPFFSTVNQHYLVSCIIHFIFILKSDIDKLPPPPNHCTTSTTYECLKCGPGSLMNVHPFFLKKSNHAMESTTHQSAGLGNRVQLQLSGSKFTAFTVPVTSLGPSPQSSTQCQQTFPCCTVCLFWLALGAREISLWCIGGRWCCQTQGWSGRSRPQC